MSTESGERERCGGEEMNYTLILTVTTWGEFVISRTNEWGNTQAVYSCQRLDECLCAAAALLGHPISFPLKAGPM